MRMINTHMKTQTQKQWNESSPSTTRPIPSVRVLMRSRIYRGGGLSPAQEIKDFTRGEAILALSLNNKEYIDIFRVFFPKYFRN